MRSLPAAILGITDQPVLLGYKYLGAQPAIPLKVAQHADVDVLVTLLATRDLVHVHRVVLRLRCEASDPCSLAAMEASVVGCGRAPVGMAGRLEAGLRAIGYAPELIEPKVTIHAYGDGWIRGGLSEAEARSLAGTVAVEAGVTIEHWTASLPRGRKVIGLVGGLMEAGVPGSIQPPILDGIDLDLDAMPERGIEWFPLAVAQAPSPSQLHATLTKIAWQRYRLDLVLDRVLQQRALPRPPRAVIRGWRELPADGCPHWVALVRAATSRTIRRLRDGRVQLELAWKDRRALAPVVALHDLDELLRWKEELGLEGPPPPQGGE